MKRHSAKRLTAAVVLAICVADCVGIYVAQVRLHHTPPVSLPDNAYATASAVKDNWRGMAPAPSAQRTFANTVTCTPSATTPAKLAAATPAPEVAPQRLALAQARLPRCRAARRSVPRTGDRGRGAAVLTRTQLRCLSLVALAAAVPARAEPSGMVGAVLANPVTIEQTGQLNLSTLFQSGSDGFVSVIQGRI